MKMEKTYSTSNELTSRTEECKKTCRVCLGNKSDKLFWLFDSFQKFTFAHYINALTDVNISRYDQLPSFICMICVKELEVVLLFKDKCEKSDKYLHNLLNDGDQDLIFVTAVKQEVLDDPVKPEDDVDDFDSGDTKEIINDDENAHVIKPEHIKKESKEEDNKPMKKKSSHHKKKKSKKNSKYQESGSYCAECDKTFPTEAKLKLHWRGVHNNLRPYQCETCKKHFKSEENYDKHCNQGITCKNRFDSVRVEGTGKDRMYFCTRCSFKNKAASGVYRHYVIHTGEHPYACNLCTKAYTSSKSLTYHKETVHKIYKKKITCPLCGKLVEGTHRFNRHFRFTHPNNQYQCDHCKVFLKSKWGLIIHLKTHEDVRDYVCETCGRAFKTPLLLRNHIRFVHEKHQYSCHLCEYKTKSSKGLKNHVLQHAQNKLQCTVCFRFYATSLKLIKHMDMHEKRKHLFLMQKHNQSLLFPTAGAQVFHH